MEVNFFLIDEYFELCALVLIILWKINNISIQNNELCFVSMSFGHVFVFKYVWSLASGLDLNKNVISNIRLMSN